jgi:hypothetical protein
LVTGVVVASYWKLELWSGIILSLCVRASSFPRDSIRTEMTDTIEKINIDNIETRIYSGSRTNLPIMISTTRNQRAGLIPHLLTSGFIPSLLMFIS